MNRLFAFFSVLLLFSACSKDSENPSPAPTPKPKFTITIAAGNGGSVSSSGGSYEQGSTVSVTATAASGYRFVGWSNGETSATLNIVVTGNISVTANFERIAYSVEVSGSITKGSFLTGSTLTFYELNNALSQTGKSYNTDITDDFGSFNLSVEELTEDYSRVVGEGFYWNEVTNETTEEKLSLNAISEIKEDINVNILTHLEYQRVVELVKNQGKTFAEAKAQALIETLSSLGIETTSNYGTSENYNFKDGDEASKILLVVSVIIQAERTTAEVTSLITTLANDLKDNGNIDNTEIKTEIALPLAKIDLEQVASNVYERYKEQNPELTESNYLSDYLETAKAEYQEFLPDADGDGVQDDLDLCPDTPEGEEADANGCGKTQKQYQLTTTVEGSGSISEEVIEQPTASYDYGTTVRLTANPISGWEFKEWKGDITSTENPIEVTVVEEVAVTAVFVKKKFTVTTTTEGEGTVSIAPEEESYEFQSNIELTATPSEGWVFSKWSGDIDSTENPLSLTVNDNKEVTAVFKRKQYELTVTVEGEGAVAEEIVTQPTQYDNGTVVKLTANGAEGWSFVAWSGDIESSENPTTITVDKEKAVTATFEKADSDGDGIVDIEDLCPDTPEGATVNANGCHDFIYVAENGVTIKARETAIVGDTQELDGETYKVVDETMLREMVTNDEDVTKVVTSFVTDMSSLFDGKNSFNSDISSWDTSAVTSMAFIFKDAQIFNQNINFWDTSKVTTLELAFYNTFQFNQPLDGWNVGNVTNMNELFQSSAFNQNINNWDTSSVTIMSRTFYGASAFNQPLDNWDVSNVVTMIRMLQGTSFDQPLATWDVSNVVDMSHLFAHSPFNQDISMWDVSNVTNMFAMFVGGSQFNQDIGDWDVSNVTSFHSMFEGNVYFNQDISRWDVSSGSNFLDMFTRATAFNQNLSSWCVTNIETPPVRFSNGILNEPIWGQCGEIKLAANGVTIVANDNAVVGESYKLTNDGDSYKVVDETMLREMVANDEDVTKVVTTRVTDINYLFYLKYDFNQDIGSWDTSNITNMAAALQAGSAFNQDISNWDTSAVQNMFALFAGLSKFNIDISGWDVSNVVNMEQMFSDCEDFNQDIAAWDVSGVQNMKYMFLKAKSFNQDLSSWEVSNVSDFIGMFYEAESFNQPLNDWDTSAAKDMTNMFLGAISFNQPLNNWDTTKVLNMSGMFGGTLFNQSIDNWDVSKVTNMRGMFGYTPFNQPLNNWDTSKVLDMDYMFQNSSFSQDISTWCVTLIDEAPVDFGNTNGSSPVWGQCGEIELAANGVTIVANDNAVVGESYKLTNDGDSYKVVDETMLREMVANDEDVTLAVTTRVTDLSLLFNLNETFNQDIGSWDTSNNTSLFATFAYTQQFNQDLTYWDTSSVSNMESTFIGAAAFNGDISTWDVSNVTNLSFTFDSATSFNGDISNWNVSNVSTMKALFANSNFNQNISNWNVSSVTNMESMFNNAGSFNQNLNNWNVSGVTTMLAMFANASAFNGIIGSWDVSGVTNMESMFSGALLFNRALNNWDVSSVDRMRYMFYNSDSFNQNLSAWCVPQFDQQPDGFNFSGIISNENLPVWGTCPDGSEGLIAYYPFNGNASDATGNGNDGTVVGATLTTDRHGNENSAYYFGDNCVDRVDANIDTSAIDDSQAFSFSIWYYYSGDGCASPRLFEFWPGSNNLTRFVAGGERDNLPFIYLGVSGSNTGSSWVSKPNQWTHLVFTVDSSSFAVYQDGELIGSGETDVNTIELPGDVAFGRMNHSAWDGIEGKLDDIRLYDIKLTSSQVQQLFEETASSNHNSGGSGGSGAGSTGS